MWYFYLESSTFYLKSSLTHVVLDKIESTLTLSSLHVDEADIFKMTENTTLHSVVLTIERKKKRRRQGIFFSSRK